MLPSPVIPAGCPHAGQPLAGLRAVPGGEHSLWVHWEPPRVPVAAYILEWQRVSSEPGRCSACWQMERDGAATAALIQGKAGGPCPPGQLKTGATGQGQDNQGFRAARAPHSCSPLCSPLQIALSLSRGTTSLCTPSTRMP